MDAIPPPPPSVMQVADRTEREIRNGDRTVREVIPPWHVLKEKFEAKSAEKDKAVSEEALDDADVVADVEEAPPSGVRVSDPGPVAGAPLTYKVYTLAELERRSDAPVSLRASRLNFDVTASRGPSHFTRVRVALVAFGTAALDWAKIKGQRPHPFVALRQPFDTLGDELQAWVQSVDWRKVGVTTGTAVGATLALLFAVLTIAELSDDLKPAPSARLAATESVGPPPPPATISALPAVNAASALQPAQAPAALAAAASEPVIEVDEPADAPEGARDKSDKKAKKPAAPRRDQGKTNKLTFRNANEIFNP
jgi:hypothetical protein